MASEVKVEVEASAPESMLSQKQDGTIGNTNEDNQGKSDLEASKGNNDNTNGECFLYPPSVEKVACEDKGRVSEHCPKAAEHDQVQTTMLGSSNQHNEIEKSETADGVQEEITRKSNLDVERKEASKEELIQSEKMEHMEDEKEETSSIEAATSLIVSDQVVISKTMKDEKEADIKLGNVSNSTFEENLENETRDEEKNSQVNVVNKDNTTEANGKEINGTLHSDLSQQENDSSLGNDSVGKEVEIHEPSSKIETTEEDKEEKMVLMERVHLEQASEVTESRGLTPSEGNADEEATVKDIELPTELVEEKCAEPLKFAPEISQEGNNSEELMETHIETKASESDLQKSKAASDDKELKDVPAEINISQQTGAEPIQQSLSGSNAGVNESIHNDDKKPSTEEGSESRDCRIEKDGHESTRSEEHTHQKNDMKDSTAKESIGDAYEMEFSNLQEETNQNMAEESATEEKAKDVKGETEQKASCEDDDFDTARISEDNTIEADVKGIADILESDPSKEENDSSLGNDSMEKKDENQESSSKIETIEEHEQQRVVSSGERNQNEQAAEVSESREFTPAVAVADEEAAVKDINSATELAEDKCAEPLESDPEKRPEGNNSEELIEANLEMKASDNALQKSGEASDEKEDVNEDVPAEVDLTQQTGPETVQQSLPGSNPKVNESIHDDDEHCTLKISDDFPTEKEGDESTFEEHTHEKNDVQDSAAKDLADASNEKELTDVQQVTVQNVAQGDTIEETAEGAKDKTEELSPGKIEDLERSTSPETTAPEQSAENVSIDETLGSTIQESEISPMENAAELTSSPVVEKIDDTPEELKVEEKSSNRPTEIDEQVDQTPLSYDAQGNSSQNLDMCNDEENEPLPTESSEMNTEALKEEPNQNPTEISENETVNITEGGFDVTGEQNRDEQQNLKGPASEETKAINEEKPDVTPNPTEEDSVAGLTDEGLTQNHQTIEEREEHVKAEPAEPSKEDDACDSQSPEIAEEMATTASSVEDLAAEDLVQSNVELNTPCTRAEGNSPEITTTVVKRTPSDQEHEGVIPISHGPSTEQNPEPLDAVKECESESAARYDNSLISANKSKEGEEQDAQPTEDMASERNDEDQGLRVPEGDNDSDVKGSINEAEDADHGATEVDHKEIQAVKQEATEEDVQHAEKGTVDELEKSDTKHEDSYQKHDEKNIAESDIAEIQEDKEEAHGRSRPNEIHVADTVKDEEIVNCELEEINTSDSIGNEEAIEASQGNGKNTSVSNDEVQPPGVQEETTCDNLQDAEDDDSNNVTDAISAEENPVPVDAVDKPELVTEPEATNDDCIASDDANKSVAERSSSVVECENDNSDKHLLQDEHSNNQDSSVAAIETELKDRELQLDEDTRSIRKEANDNDMKEIAHDEEKLEAAIVDTPQQHYKNSAAELDNIEVEKNGKAHEQSESEEILRNDEVRHEVSVDQRFESISSNEVANQESTEASPSHGEHTNTSSPGEGNQFIEVQDEAAIKEQHENFEDETPIIDGVSAEENPEPVGVVEKLDITSAAACDDDLSSETQETSHVEKQDAQPTEHQPTVGYNDNQALSITTADNEMDDERSKNKSEDAAQEKIEQPKVDPPQKLDESTTTESEHLDVRKDGELKTSGTPETCGTDTVNDEEIVNQDRNSDTAMGDEETVDASPSQDEKPTFSDSRIQDIGIQDKAKTDEQPEKIEDENSRDISKDASIEENPKQAEDVELLKCGTRSAAADDNSITSDEANKSAEHEIQEEQNANQGLSVTGVGNQLEDEEPMGKGEDANQCASMVEEAKELKLNEETQSIAKKATNENSQQVADSVEEFADANNDSEQNDQESTTEIDNNEVLQNVKTHEESGSEVIHGKETRDEELVDKRIAEINSANQTANQESTEASPSQDDCTMASDDSNQVTEVQAETTMVKPNEKIEVEDITKMIDNVSAEENPEPPEAAEKLECCTNSDAATERTITSDEAVKSATEESNKAVKYPGAPSAEQLLQEGHSKNKDFLNKEGDANQDPEPVDAVEKLDSESVATCEDSQTYSEVNKSGTEETQDVEEKNTTLAEHLPAKGDNDNQGAAVTRVDNELNNEGSIKNSECLDQEATEGKPAKRTQNMKQVAPEHDFQNEKVGEIEDEKDREEEHEPDESNETHGADIVTDKEKMSQDSNCGNAIGNEEAIEAFPSHDGKDYTSNDGNQVIGVQEEAKMDEQQGKIEDENSSNIIGGVPVYESSKPAEDVEEHKCGSKSAVNDVSVISNEAIKSVEQAIQEEESDNQGLAITGLDNEFEDEDSTSKREKVNQAAEDIKLTDETQSVTKEATDEDLRQVANDKVGILSKHNNKTADHQCAQRDELLLQEGYKEDEGSVNIGADANQVAWELDISTETGSVRNEAAEEAFQQVTDDEEKVTNGNVESPQQPGECSIAEIGKTKPQRDEDAHEQNEGSEIHGKDKVLNEEIMTYKSEESNNAEQSQKHVEAFTSNTNAESPIPTEDKCNIDNEEIQVTEVQKEATTQSQNHSTPNDSLQDKDPIKSTDNVSEEENLEQPECDTELKKHLEANTSEGETTSRDVNDLESSATENMTGSGYIEAESLGIEGKGSPLAKATTEKEEEADESAEDNQINTEPEGIDNSKSNKEDIQQTITEEAKPMDSSGDLSQLENERNTSASDDVQVHEKGQTIEICKFGEMDGSDFDKEKEIINHGFEPDNSRNDVQDQQCSPGVEASGQTGDEKDALSLYECPEISSDQAQVAEAIKTKARDKECQTHKSDGPESTNMIPAEEVKHVETLISGNKTEPVEDVVKDGLNEEQDASVPAMTSEETIKEEDKQGADSVEVKLNITNMSKAEEIGSLEQHSEGSIIKTLGVSSAEETPEVDENNTKGIPSEIEQPENPPAGEINREHESGDVASTEENANQSAGKQELENTQQGSKIASSINFEAAEAIITEEDQLHRPSSEQQMENEDTIATEDQEESLTDVQILRKERSEDKFLENATQKAEGEPKVPTSDFEPAEGSQLKQELVEEAGKKDESSIAERGDLSSGSEFQGTNAPSESVTERDIDSCPRRIINENEVQLTNKSEQVANVSEDQKQSESSKQVLKLHGQGITKPEETGKEEHHNAIIRELIPEENQGKKDSEANDATISDTQREENLGLVDPLKNLEGSSDLVVASEKITEGEADLAENEENITEMAGHKAYSVGNQHGGETILSMNQKETNSNECSMDKTEEVDQVIEGPRINDKSDECEREIMKEDLQQDTTGEQAENEEKHMITEVHIPKQAAERNTSELENIEVQKDVIGLGAGEDSSSIKEKNQQSSRGDEVSGLQKGAEDNTQNHEYAEISSNTTAVRTQHPAPPDNVSTEEVKYMYEPIPTDKTSTEAHDSNASDAKDIQAEQAPVEESRKAENTLTQQPDFPEENPKEDKKTVACEDNMSNTENKTLVKEEPSSEGTLPQSNIEKDLDISSNAKNEQQDDGEKFSLEVEELAARDGKETISVTQLEHTSRDVALAKDNANQLAEMLHVDNTGGVMIPNDMESRTNCQDVEEVTAADIIASQISQAIEQEEQRQQQSAEHLKNDNTSDNEVLKEEDKSHTCLEETTKQTSLPEERETERKLELQKDWQPKQETEEQIEKIDDVKMADTEDFPADFQGADSPLKIGTDKVSETSTEILNNKEIKDSNKLVSPQLDTVCQSISEESHANSCTATTDDNKQTASLDKVPEIHDEGQSKSDKIDLEKHHKTISSELLADEKSVLTSEADQTTMSDAIEETGEQKGIHAEGQHPADEETIARTQKADDKQTAIEKTKILDEKVQVSQRTTESDDKAEESTTEDEEERTMESSTLLLSGQKETAFRGKVSSLDIPNTQASILVPRTPEVTEDKKAKNLTDDSDSPSEPKHPENVITVTDGLILEKCAINTYEKPCQLSKESQQPTPEVIQEDRVRVQDRNDKESLEIQQMENTAKLENTNVPCKLVGKTMDASLNKMHPQGTTKEAPEEVNQIGSCPSPSQVTSTTDFHGNKVVTLQQQEPLKGLQIEEADESSTGVHMAESKARSMQLDSGRITAQTCQKGRHMTNKGGQTIPKEDTPDGKEAMAEEQKTDEEKDESIDQSYEDLQREIPITAEGIREMELKATQKKSHNLLSGVGSKVKHSISKMKKAIACSSAQFSQEDVIIKVNKNKKV